MKLTLCQDTCDMLICQPLTVPIALQGFLIQTLAAKLGVATGLHLAQHCRCALNLQLPEPLQIDWLGQLYCGHTFTVLKPQEVFLKSSNCSLLPSLEAPEAWC